MINYYDNDLLIPTDIANVPAIDNKEFDDLVASQSFLPRIQLFGGNSTAAKEGLIQMGTYGIVKSKDAIDSLGNEVDCIPITYHFKAMCIADGEVETVLDHKSARFEEIKDKAGEEDSGCMYGVEFLLWIPRGEGQYVTFFLNSKSSRRVAPDLRGLLGKRATLKVTLVKTKKYSWHAPVVTGCSTPFTPIPNPEDVPDVVNKFNSIPTNGDEVIKETGSNERAR